jgi:hypothetical protein
MAKLIGPCKVIQLGKTLQIYDLAYILNSSTSAHKDPFLDRIDKALLPQHLQTYEHTVHDIMHELQKVNA